MCLKRPSPTAGSFAAVSLAAPPLFSPFPAACGRASPASAALGLCCLHPRLGAVRAPGPQAGDIARGAAPKTLFTTPALPANYFDPRASTA